MHLHAHSWVGVRDHEGGVCTDVPTDPSLGTLDNSLLDFDQYVSRDTSWNGAEYTGYSLYNQVQIADLDTVSLKDVEGVDTKNAYIGYVLPNVTCNTIGQSCGPQNKDDVLLSTSVLSLELVCTLLMCKRILHVLQRASVLHSAK
jgi:hypothetical protein